MGIRHSTLPKIISRRARGRIRHSTLPKIISRRARGKIYESKPKIISTDTADPTIGHLSSSDTTHDKSTAMLV